MFKKILITTFIASFAVLAFTIGTDARAALEGQLSSDLIIGQVKTQAARMSLIPQTEKTATKAQDAKSAEKTKASAAETPIRMADNCSGNDYVYCICYTSNGQSCMQCTSNDGYGDSNTQVTCN